MLEPGTVTNTSAQPENLSPMTKNAVCRNQKSSAKICLKGVAEGFEGIGGEAAWEGALREQ